jgi:competence protein ComEC
VQEEREISQDDSDVGFAGSTDSSTGIFDRFRGRFYRAGIQEPVWQKLVRGRQGRDVFIEDPYWDNHGLLWCTFSFAAGIAIYRLFPEEPNWVVLTCLLLLGCVPVFIASRLRSPGKPVVLMLMLVCGLTAASIRTAYVDAPRLGEAMNATLTGHVLQLQKRATGKRILLQVASINERPVNKIVFPKIVRLRIPADSQVEVGNQVRVKARLFPPSGPVSPGSYDFSYRAFYSQIGASGFSFGPPVPIIGSKASVGLLAAAKVQALRNMLAGRINATLQRGPEAALAVALLVGDRSAISKDREQDLRAAGLAHILAISGLHMALFAGGAYGVTLLLLALFPPLTLRWPIHKWAALSALLAASAYLVLSGASVATQRSFLMVALVFLGVFLGRRALTLRSVALAGLVLLLIAPERLFYPGFQMSFAAVICLVAVYEQWRAHQAGKDNNKSRERGRFSRAIIFVGKWGAGLFVTAFVAGLATGIIGAHHFGRVAPYGLLGNLLGMPVFSLLIMPMGVLALVLMPLGLAALPLTVMSFGLSILLKIAAFTANLGDGAGMIGNIGALTTLLFMTALFISLLVPGRWRLFAGIPFAAGSVLIAMERPPDIQIANSGTRVAARDADGTLRLSSSRSSFVSEIWLQREGVDGSAIKSRKMKSDQRQCDGRGCVVSGYSTIAGDRENSESSTSLKVALPKTAEAFFQDCRYADLIVSDLIAPENCKAEFVLDKSVRTTKGAVSIWLTNEWRVQTVAGTKHEANGANTDEGGSAGVVTMSSSKLDAAQQYPLITKIRYAIPDPPRPWHQPGTVTRASLRRAARAQ